MRIAWHGHACFEVQGESTVVTDPHDGRSLGIPPPACQPDVVLVSHDHFDHNCVRVFKNDPVVVREAGDREVRGIRIRGVEAAHDDSGGSKRGKVVMFRFEMGGVTFLHCGDLGHALSPAQQDRLGRVDVLFVPVGGVFTLDGEQARRLVDRLRPRVAVPMHYRYGGLALSIQGVDGFLQGVPKEKVRRVGNETEFAPEDLPPATEYWLFSP